MGRAPCCEKIGLRRGRWTAEEDKILSDYIQEHGEGSWRSLPKNAGLLRCGKSCRLRWINYLRSDVKRGNISAEEEDIVIKLQASLGNRWSLIASHLAGRTDNEIKNYWNSHLSRKVSPSGSTVPAGKIKKPRKKPLENQSNMTPSLSTDGGGELMPDSSTSGGDRENFEGLLMDPNGVCNNLNSTSSSTNDSNQVNQVDWNWEWDFEDGNIMVGLGGGEEEDDIMSWPWESPTQVGVDVDVEKQDAMITWLLS
ncbi:hypothetical protein L1987_86191 [Smallanthus sonchifolius]|uniref:Uncharacterized protein n=1 Tax=Smallanthus sonchifolius TaxID=185202 RepID=A0ACB8Y2S9_9ASTR|nr:hypothetical protein L1987_86191 [Smallanthus sonchifolius]